MSDFLSGVDPLVDLAEEFAARCRRGERPSVEEYVARFPHLGEPIRELFPTLMVMEELGSVAAAPGAPAAGGAPPPRRLGEYRVLREVARGGMGVVYEAVQESLGRHVALKVLPFQGLRDEARLERFRREARHAAQLHHTNIVPVYAVGEHEGLHYYAMQFILGQGLDAVIAEMRRQREAPPETPAPNPDLTVSLARGSETGSPAAGQAEAKSPGAPGGSGSSSLARLARTDPGAPAHVRYFRSVARMGVQVAGALAYAHGQRVLHRDIKPSNLLLDTQGAVWVTDFGLAKAEGAEDLTVPGDLVGTLRYMAPERFDGRADARSDLYSVGLTLYELLTLRPAFTAPTRPQLVEQILHTEPPRPRAVDAGVPRDLETVVLKAMAREPRDRYQTAEALAEDLNRFLADRPILARRTGAVERLRKWAKRRPAAAALTVVCVLFTLALLVGSWWHNLELTDALARLTTEEEKARTEEKLARDAVAKLKVEQKERETAYARLAKEEKKVRAERDRAEENDNETLAVVDQFLTRLDEEKLAHIPGMEKFRKNLLEDALRFFQHRLRQQGKEPSVRRETAQAYRRVAQLHLLLGRADSAREACEKALELQEALVAVRPRDLRYRADLAQLLNQFGILQEKTGKPGEAERCYRRSCKIRQELVDEFPANRGYRAELAAGQVSLGVALERGGDLPGAEAAQRLALKLQQDLLKEVPGDAVYRRGLGFAYANLGNTLRTAGQYPQAEAMYREALKVRKKLADDHRGDAGYQQSLGYAYSDLGMLLSRTYRLKEAEEAFREALKVRTTLLILAPYVLDYWQDKASTHGNLAVVLYRQERMGEAEKQLRTADEGFTKITQMFPTNAEFRRDHAGVLSNLASVLEKGKKIEEAEGAYLRAAKLFGALAKQMPKVPDRWYDLADAELSVGRMQALLKRPEEAEPRFARALELFEKLAKEFPGTPEYRTGLSRGLVNFGNFHKRAGKPKQAEALLRRACAVVEGAVKVFRKSPEVAHDAAHSYVFLALFLRSARRPDDTAVAYHRALYHFGRAANLQGGVAHYRADLARCHYCLGEALEQAGKLDEAEEPYLRAVEERRQLAQANPAYRWEFAGTSVNVANFYSKQERYKEAEPHYRAALAVGETQAREKPDDAKSLRALVLAYSNFARLLASTGRPWEAEQALTRAARLARQAGTLPPPDPTDDDPEDRSISGIDR